MNEVLQNIMTFINEHTILLIGICVFLILVLVGYLIDNSVKSKRIRKDIKNADQVPENIKEEIIKAAEEKGTIVKTDETTKQVQEEIKTENQNTNTNVNVNVSEEIKPTVDLTSNAEEVKVENNVQNNEIQNTALDNMLNLDINAQSTEVNSELNLDSSLNVQDKPLDNNAIFGANINLDNNVNPVQTDTLNFDLDLNKTQDTQQVDPDAFIMGAVNNNEYKNNKSLSEILSSNVSLNNEVNINNINEAPLNIEIDTNTNNAGNTTSAQPQDELEKIMQKLSSMKTDTEEDNYTNIF